ncbi:FAD-dependent oxidoreductase (GlcD/DLD domain protein) (plasmid) [Natrialba magadii ATCC 43099]|uniref:D-lactate dehydrogenase (cytochrome) n=1 Tax=Natrialba magadii (strain ATCC 43099 / DSM 3394 / CCM 3739 / CIP 104546 / IAM 13178 / JCM 8861 / NBRC 102185 / NCIMB 2190 / MS3) TaxID=547559 RepID=D3T1L7_NATMM|nr:FAD-binding oxidoreductase [Natrialba magadii]ADD07476.1 FAD-dependent oxidoreductase (GlcD/DLD domain protein) [Natrialba magadii ATCC 43099]ELY32194.1 FAD linked oxidase domain-containing protein [Natrialba magadii ATCC 43099]
MAHETGSGSACRFLADLPIDGRVSFEASARKQHVSDESGHTGRLPEAVVWAASTDDVATVLQAANDRGIPVTPWSGGSGLEGNAVPVDGGIVLNTAELTDIDVSPADMQATVGAGVVYDDLNEELAAYGLRFAPGISSGEVATMGGMVATNASGFNAVRYGETRDHIRRLEVVTADGRVVECGRGVVKTSAGYSLKDLLVGSEGTLGVVTEATIGLVGIPEHRRAALVTFPDRESASRAVADAIGSALVPGALEFIDEMSTKMLNAYRDDAPFTEQPTLLIELHANNDGIEEDLAFAKAICEDHGMTSWEAAAQEDIDEIWQARRDKLFATRSYREEWDIALVGDVVVPISSYPEIVQTVQEVSDDLDLVTSCVGHAGDGNLHFTPLVDPDDEEMVERAHELNERVVTRAIELGGTATGEHGVGIGKRKFMADEHGAALELMQSVKETMDPNGILNPGKVLPERE